VRCAADGTPRRVGLEVADIVRAYEQAYRHSHTLTLDQATVLRAIARCRTAALGGHLDECDLCGRKTPAYNSCRNRHCPKCQGLAQAKWIAEREERILPVRHFHVVFTLPSELHGLARFRRDTIFDLLFASASAALLDLAHDPRHLGADIGVTAVLHTWTRELLFHPHVHCIVSGGGLALDGSRWISAPRRYLFPVKVLGALLRGKILDGLRKAHARGLFDGFDDFRDPEGFDRLMRRLAGKDWVVYAKRAFGGAEQIYRYLGRYTHRVGIANSRLVSLVEDRVTFRTKSGKAITVHAVEFLRRFLLHVLPRHFVKIRHYGLLAPSNVNTKLVVARAALGAAETSAPVPSGRAILDELTEAHRHRRCPACKIGTLHSKPLPQPAPTGTTPSPTRRDTS
jgi:hypothetical protein